MAATTALVATAIGTTAYSARQSRNATRAQTRASGQAVDAMAEAEARALEMQRPSYEAGYAATAAMMDMTGLDRSGMGSAARRADAEERGLLVGDTLLPEGTTTKSVGDGWYEVWYDEKRIGTLRPGGPNGIFENDTGFDVEGAFAAQSNANSTVPGDLSSYPKYDWKQDPGYQFRLDEGMRALERGAAARGILQSGGTIRSATRYAQDYASNEYQRVFDRIATIAGRGQNAANAGSDVIVNTGSNIGRALVNAGEARASGYVAQGNAWANLGGQMALAYGSGMFGKTGGSNLMGWNYQPNGAIGYA